MPCSTFFFRKLARALYGIPHSIGYAIWSLGSKSDRLERRNWDRLTEMAGRKGFLVVQPPADQNSGIVYGEVNGYISVLQPYDAGHSTVSALFRNVKQTVIGIPVTSATGSAMSELAPLGKNFKRVFRYCSSSGDELARLKQHPEVLEHLADFYCKWVWYLSKVTVNEFRVVCRLRQAGAIPAVPVSLAEKLVPELTRITSELESVLGQSGQPIQAEQFAGGDGS